MKKCFFYLTMFLISAGFLSEVSADDCLKKISAGISSGFQLYNQNPEKNSWNFSVSSINISFQDFDLKTCWKIPSTTFSSTPELSMPSYSFDLRLKELAGIPLTFRGGNLSPCGAISRLSSPALTSSAQSLSTSISGISRLSASSAGISTMGSPFSVFYEFSIPHLPKIFQKTAVTCYSCEEYPAAAGLFFSLKPNRKLLISFSTTAGLFSLENSSSSWFSDTKFFQKDLYYAQNFQLFFQSPFYSGKITCNLYQNPFNRFNETFTSENLFKISGFSINISAFSASSMELYTASSSRLKTLFQAKINPVFTFFPSSNSSKIKAGLVFITEDKIQEDNSSEFISKAGSALSFQTHSSTCNLNFSVQNISFVYGFSQSVFKAVFSRSQSARFLKPYETASLSYSPEDKKTSLQLSARLTLPVPFYLNFKSSLSVSFTEKELSALSAELLVSGKIQLPKTSLNYSIGVKYIL